MCSSDLHRTTEAGPRPIIPPGADGQIGDAVAVQITQRGEGSAEEVLVGQRRSAAPAAGDLAAALDRHG